MIHKPAINTANNFPPISNTIAQVIMSVIAPKNEGQNFTQKKLPPNAWVRYDNQESIGGTSI